MNRLPQNVLDTFVFVLINKPPKALFSHDELAKDYIPSIITKGRNRDVFKYLDGKAVIVVREMETDVLDFITNMCINTIETKKLTKLINNPIVLGQFFEFGDDFDKSIEILEDATKNKISHSEKESLKKFFGKNIGKTLINMCLHHSDYSINIRKLLNSSQDPSEKWI